MDYALIMHKSNLNMSQLSVPRPCASAAVPPHPNDMRNQEGGRALHQCAILGE